MGSVGAQRTISGATVRDDYGRTYPVVTREDVPSGYSLWASGSWRGANADYNNGYVVFAPINNFKVNTDKGVVVRISGDDVSAIKKFASIDEKDPVGAAERYVKRYSNSKNSVTRRRAEAYRDLIPVLKRLGF